MEAHEWISFLILIVLQIVGIAITVWQLVRSSEGGVIKMLIEKDGPHAGEISFSRVSGTLGALTLASLFVANVFWVHNQLYEDAPDLSKAKDLWPVYIFGTALFAPYAFNRLARLGQSDDGNGDD